MALYIRTPSAVALKLPVVREKLSDVGTDADSLTFGPESLGLPQHTPRASETLGKDSCGLLWELAR